MYERKRIKPLSSVTTLRHTQPGGNARNFTNMQPRLGKRAFQPSKLGCVESADWSINGGTSMSKVDKL
jgi:hypothetical protein